MIRTQIETFIKEKISKSCGISVSKISLEKHFSSYGLDSVEISEIFQDLQSTYTLSTEELVEASELSTLSEVAEFFSSTIKKKRG